MSTKRRPSRTAIGNDSNAALTRCSVPGCGRLPEKRQGDGLSPTLCRYHREFKARHGSAFCRSPTGRQVRPYLGIAEAYVAEHLNDATIRHSLEQLKRHLETAGRIPSVAELPILSAEQKARGVLARLRESDVPPDRILAVTLGVMAAIKEQYVQPGGDYAKVAVAKALKRRASGNHGVYGPDSRWDHYPESRGRFLVELGAMTSEALTFRTWRRRTRVVRVSS